MQTPDAPARWENMNDSRCIMARKKMSFLHREQHSQSHEPTLPFTQPETECGAWVVGNVDSHPSSATHFLTNFATSVIVFLLIRKTQN